jgi:hypothetical protein
MPEIKVLAVRLVGRLDAYHAGKLKRGSRTSDAGAFA